MDSEGGVYVSKSAVDVATANREAAEKKLMEAESTRSKLEEALAKEKAESAEADLSLAEL